MAVRADAPGTPRGTSSGAESNHPHMHRHTDGEVDTARAESAVFRIMPAVDQSQPLMEVRAVGEYDKFFQGQVQSYAHPLSEYYATWLELCTPLPRWISMALSMGLRLMFRTKPPPFNGIKETILTNQQDAQLLLAEIQELLKKGAISLVPESLASDGYFSTYFLIPKKDGGFRAVMNLNTSTPKYK